MENEVTVLLETLGEGEESPVMDFSGDICFSKFTLSEEQSKRPGVLCTLEGVGMGPFGEENRNIRDYPVEVASVSILQSSYVKEMLKNKTLLGEPHHPKDRNEVWCDQVSHAIVDMWMSPDNKYLMIRIDVLDTPSGRILKTLVDYGCILGISARASGKTRKAKGRLTVVPEAYKFKTFDVVTNPGFEAARLTQVNEEVEDGISLREGFERLVESTDLVTLKSVKQIIEYCDDEEVKDLLPLIESQIESVDNSTVSEANESDSLVDDLMEELANSRQREAELKAKVSSLTTQVAFFSSKSKKQSGSDQVEVLTEGIVNLKRALKIKEENITLLHEDNLQLMEQLDESNRELEETKIENEDLREQVEVLTESRQTAVKSLRAYRELNEEYVLSSIESEEETETQIPEEDTIVRRRKVGIGNVVSGVADTSLYEERRGEVRRQSLIKKIGGNI